MPYISKVERERQRARQQEQKERARWMHFKDAVTYVQEKEGCTAETAAEQLITAIIDQALAARWDDEGGLKPITPSEFSGTLKICLDGVGFVKRYHAAAKIKPIARSTRNYPKLEFVDGPVIDADDRDRRFSEVNTLDYIPLLLLKEDIHRWPLEHTSAEVRNTGKKVQRIELEEDSDRWPLENSGSETRTTGEKARRPRPPSLAAITELARKIYRSNPLKPPNINVAEKLVRKEHPGAT